jgi:hypothetical protein
MTGESASLSDRSHTPKALMNGGYDDEEQDEHNCRRMGTANAALAQNLPRTPLLEPAPPAVTPYNPPAINSPSDQIIQSDQSFQSERGLGNNLRGAFVREQLGK